MKNLVKIICGLSVFAFATVACNKEIESEAPEVPAVAKHTVKIVADVDATTKTAMLPAGNQTAWTDADIPNIHIFENGIAPADPANDLYAEIVGGKMQITATFADTGASEYTYTSILSSDLDASFNATLPADQDIIEDTFDPAADILVAKPVEADPNDIVDFQMQYKRVVAINKIKIKGLTNDDVIQSVTISSNKPFLGSYNMTNDEWTNSGYELTLTKSDDITVSGGEVSLWFITAPVQDATLSIYVITDKHIYEKDFTKTITFAANTVTSFATTVAGCEVEVTSGTDDYIRVESNSDLGEGDYVLVTETSGNILNGISTTSTKYGTYESIDVTVDNVSGKHIIDADDVDSDNIIHLSAATDEDNVYENDGTGYIMEYGNDLLFWSSGNSLNKTSDNESNQSRWTISVTSGNATIANVSSLSNDASTTRVILWNAASGTYRFACYADKTPNDAGNQYHHVQLFKKDEGGIAKSALAKPVVTLERNATLDGIIVTWTDVNKAANYTVACTGQASQTVAQGVETYEFENLDPGTYTVTVTANPANADRNTATTSDAESLDILDYQLVAPTMSFTPSTTSIIVTWSAVENASSYTYTVLDSGDNVIVDETNTENLTFTASGLTENTTYTFKIKSIGEAPYISSEYRTQTQKTSKGAITTIAAIKEEIAADITELEATLTNAVVTRKYSDAVAYIQDNTAGILVTDAAGLTEGDSYTGVITGTMGISNNQPKITAIDVSAAQKSTGASKTPVEVTIATLNSNMSDYDGMLCKIVKAKAGANLATGNNKSISISQGSNSLTFFTRVSFAENSVVKDNYYDIIGLPCQYNSTKEIVVVKTSDVSESSITWQLKSIAVATQPTKKTYTVGEYFDPTGLVISTVVEDADDQTIFKNGSNVAYAGHEDDFSFNPSLTTALTTDHSSVTITYGGKEASQAITVNNGGGGGDTHDDIVINLDFSDSDTYPNTFPTSSGTATGSYAFGDYTFGFKANTAFYFNSSYLMIGKSGKTEATTSYIELPAPDNYILTEISITASSGTSENLKAYVGSSYSSKVTGDWQFAKSGTSNWTLSSVTAGTTYRIYFVATGNSTYNGQITALHAKYVYDE